MKKLYAEAKVEILALETADVITLSSPIDIRDDDKDEGGNKWGPIQR